MEHTGGSVVNIGRIHSKLTKPGFLSYATSKSALTGLTQSLAVDLGARIRVNEIQPAATDTEMLRKGFKNDPAAYDRLKGYHPLQCIASPDNIASAVIFLLSDKSSFISGSILSVDGAIGCRLHDPS